jgi:transglutaminase-like putative cysteine protease
MVSTMRDLLATLPVPRQLLAVLVVLLALLVFPHAGNLPAAVLAAFYVTAAWRLLALRRPGLMPRRWLLGLLTLAGLGLVVVSSGLHDGRLTATALLVVMLGLKLLEVRARRDMHVTLYLGYFLVLTQFLYDQSLGLALVLFAGVAALAVVQLGLSRAAPDWRQQLRDGLGMLAAALPLALVLFLFFPRLESPLWSVSAPSAITGISGEMTLGSIGELSRSQEIAFRVEFLDQVPEPAQRYWRGPVLWETDGQRWSAGMRPVQPVEPVAAGPGSFEYELTLEPTGQYWLFGLDVVTQPPAGARLNRNFALVGDNRVNRRFSYRAVSDPDYRIRGLGGYEQRMGLQLPEQVSPRVRALAEGWRAQSDPARPIEVVQRALDYFRQEPFVYTLSPGQLDGDPIDAFLFESRRGFCEHYAGSFVLLMRLAGVPARVVIGYQGGEKNPHADHWVVRQSDAHAWAEVWLPELGWWRVDPTAAVAPERIEQVIDTARFDDTGRVLFRTADTGWLRGALRQAAWLADAVDLGWHRWVVGFSAKRQGSLLERLGLDGGYWLVALLVAGAAAASLFAYLLGRLPRRQGRDPLQSLWQEHSRRLQRAGVPLQASQGPETVSRLAASHLPPVAAELGAIGRIYAQLRYGRRSDPGQLRALRRRIRALRLPRRA